MGHPCTLAFSRILAGQEILVAYNTSTTERRTDYVVVDSTIQKTGTKMEFLYGAEAAAVVEQHRDPGNLSKFVKLDPGPMQFMILRKM